VRLSEIAGGSLEGVANLSHPAMAANPTPTNPAELMAALMDMARACAAHGEAVGLKINTGPVMEAAVKQAQDTQAEAGSCKAERGAARRAFLAADAESKRTLGRCRLRLVMFYGQTFSVQWEAAGFPDSSTQVPESHAKRAGLLSRLAGWFGANPELESADMQATAAACTAAHESLRAARREVIRTETALATAVQAKDEAIEKLRTRFRSVISELDVLLATDDPRWRLFGLKLPAQLSAPDPVPAAKAEKLPSGAWLLTWERARHARRYRVQLLRPGSDSWEHLRTVHSLELLLEDLPTDLSAPEFQIIAANDAGEAAACVVTLD
jgi:hypothetical protein